jgi:DNA (cytosine-5)-methyltransferase 1
VIGLDVLDLFCGAGGLSEGFRQAGFGILAGTDVDPDACATYSLNFPEARTVVGNLRDPLVKEAVLDRGAAARVVVGGPPCQAFSQVRNHVRLIDDPRNSLYREVVHVVEELLPVCFVMENVLGLEQMGAKEQVLEDLSLDGEYRVVAQVLDAADFGVPQTRRRLVFIGIRRSLGSDPPGLRGTRASLAVVLARRNGCLPIRYELSEQPQAGIRSFLERLRDPDDLTVVSAEQAIGDLEMLQAGSRADEIRTRELPSPSSAYQRAMRRGAQESIPNVSVPRINRDTVLRLDQIPSGGNYRDLPEPLRARYLTGERWGPHNGTGRLGRRHYYAYRRLHREFWSWTINTKADSVYHYDRLRALSVRELARLQSFPDRFRFTTDPRRGELPGRIDGGAAHSRYRQVGNAVPPLLARAIAQALRALILRDLGREQARGSRPASVRSH